VPSFLRAHQGHGAVRDGCPGAPELCAATTAADMISADGNHVSVHAVGGCARRGRQADRCAWRDVRTLRTRAHRVEWLLALGATPGRSVLDLGSATPVPDLPDNHWPASRVRFGASVGHRRGHRAGGIREDPRGQDQDRRERTGRARRDRTRLAAAPSRASARTHPRVERVGVYLRRPGVEGSHGCGSRRRDRAGSGVARSLSSEPGMAGESAVALLESHHRRDGAGHQHEPALRPRADRPADGISCREAAAVTSMGMSATTGDVPEGVELMGSRVQECRHPR
jgi:hypothetical protein